jgi:hypothetical protein
VRVVEEGTLEAEDDAEGLAVTTPDAEDSRADCGSSTEGGGEKVEGGTEAGDFAGGAVLVVAIGRAGVAD